MKVSLNTVKQLIDFELPPTDELVARVNAQLGGVEEIIDLADKYKDALIVRVVECKKHENADKLSVCRIDDGGARENVERGDDGLVQVVCGAPNVHADMWAVWLPPAATVPASYDDAEPFVLSARELRGVLSQGMLAAADELAIGTEHNGIVELTDADLTHGKELSAGASFAETFELNDTILDIENKMFTHRPDCFGQLGVAREISAILGGLPKDANDTDTRFVNPDWYWSQPQLASAVGLDLTVKNETPDSVPRLMAVALQDIEIKPSPMWLRATLVRWGAKPINNVVDLTNYIMLLTAQPTHAYDYDKLRGHEIAARMARDGEMVKLLNGKTYELMTDDIVIADAEGPVALGGIMGGGESEVSADTTRIVLEAASFDMYTVRKSSMRHGVFTDALARFNKGQSPLQNDRVLAHLMMLVQEIAGGVQASDMFDVAKNDWMQEMSLSGEVPVRVDFVNSLLGSDLADWQIGGLLRRTNFASYPAENNPGTLQFIAPFWRTDIEQPEDIVEEVGRLYGFDKLPRDLPMRSMRPASKNVRREVKENLRHSLEKLGANEVLTYSFVHENVMKRAEQDVSQAFQLSNALSPDLQYYRLSVLPSLLDKVHMNIKAGHDEFMLYEIGKAHNKKYHATDDEGLPGEIEMLDAVYASKKPGEGAPFYYMRRLAQALALDHGFTLRFKPITEIVDYPLTTPFDLQRSASLETWDGTFVGMIGELKQSVIKNFKLPQYAAAMSLDMNGLVAAITQSRQTYTPLSKYPSVTQDVTLRVTNDTTYEMVAMAVLDCIKETEYTIKMEPRGIYQSADDTSSKSITLRLVATSEQQTLTDSDVERLINHIQQAVHDKIGIKNS